MKIKTTYREISETTKIGGWQDFCEDIGLPETCVEDSMVSPDDTVFLQVKQAIKYGLAKQPLNRSNQCPNVPIATTKP